MKKIRKSVKKKSPQASVVKHAQPASLKQQDLKGDDLRGGVKPHYFIGEKREEVSEYVHTYAYKQYDEGLKAAYKEMGVLAVVVIGIATLIFLAVKGWP